MSSAPSALKYCILCDILGKQCNAHSGLCCDCYDAQGGIPDALERINLRRAKNKKAPLELIQEGGKWTLRPIKVLEAENEFGPVTP